MKQKLNLITFVILFISLFVIKSAVAERWDTRKITVNFEKLGTRTISVYYKHDSFFYYFSVKHIDGREYLITEYSILGDNLGLSTGREYETDRNKLPAWAAYGGGESKKVIMSRTHVQNFTKLQFKNTVTDMARKAYLLEGNNGSIYVIVLSDQPIFESGSMKARLSGRIYLLIGEIE